ncbi:hypothetical protein ACEPAI_9628 [Sanghuangporus weigelae]
MDRGSAWSYVRAHVQCDILRLIVGIARGPAYLHDQDVVHSDIKSDNVLVSTDGEALLCDFGCARITSASRSIVIPSSGIRGTSRYLACELLEYSTRTVGHTKSSDVWAFGMTVFELFARQRPYADLSDAQSMAAIIRHEMPILPQQSEYRTSQTLDQTRDIWDICLDCWKHEPDRRPDMHAIIVRLTSKQVAQDYNQKRSGDATRCSPPVISDSGLNGLKNASRETVLVALRATQGPTNNTYAFVVHQPPLIGSFPKKAELREDSKGWFAVLNPYIEQIHDVHLGRTLKHESPVECVRFSADGKFLAACCRRIIRIYDTKTWRRTCSLYDGSLDSSAGLYIQSLCFSPDGRYIAFEAAGNSIKVWEIMTRRARHIFQGHRRKIHSIEFSHNGKSVVSASSDSTVRIWNVGEGLKKVLQSKGPPNVFTEMNCAAISPDDKLVAAGSSDSVVRIWEMQSGNLVERLRGHQESVSCVSFSPNGTFLLSGSADKTVKQWDISALVAVPGRRLPLPPEKKSSSYVNDITNIDRVEIQFSRTKRRLPDPPTGDRPDGVIDGSSLGAKLAFRDGERGSVNVMAFLGHRDCIIGTSMSPDGRWIASVSKDHSICIVENRTGTVALMLRCSYGPALSVSFSQSDSRVSVGCADRHARICEISIR